MPAVCAWHHSGPVSPAKCSRRSSGKPRGQHGDWLRELEARPGELAAIRQRQQKALGSSNQLVLPFRPMFDNNLFFFWRRPNSTYWTAAAPKSFAENRPAFSLLSSAKALLRRDFVTVARTQSSSTTEWRRGGPSRLSNKPGRVLIRAGGGTPSTSEALLSRGPGIQAQWQPNEPVQICGLQSCR